MAVSEAIRRAVLRAEGTQVNEVFSSTDQVCVEMADLSNEVAAEIVSAHDWRSLVRIGLVVGTGAQSYDLPADFGRMTAGGEVDDPSTWFWGYEPFTDVNEWMRFKAGGFLLVGNGGWIIIGGQLQFYPAPSGSAQYPYVSRFYARAEDGSEKPEFTADDDTFVLSERLLTLGLIWRWKAQKGLEYGEDMAAFDLALAQQAVRDKGSYVTRRHSAGLRGVVAYSGRAIR